jgi:hypothetical protein
LFWLAPLIGGAVGGLLYRALAEPHAFRRQETQRA